jgi:uncharacterized protein
MDPEVLQQALWMAGQGQGALHIQLTGGEPCLVPGLIEQAVKGARQIQRPLTMGIQVNGTCLTQEIIDLFKEFRLQVGVSLDGAPKIQESLRGRAKETLHGLMLLEQAEVPFRITTVVSEVNVLYLEQLAMLLAGFRQARGIGLDLLVNKGSGANPESGPGEATPGDLHQGLQRLAQALVQINSRRKHPIRLREWDLVGRMLSRGRISGTRLFCQAAQGASMAVHPDGRCFPCSQTMGDNRFGRDLANSHAPPRIPVTSLMRSKDDCIGCRLEHCCPGECPSRLLYNPPATRRLACVLYQSLAELCET